MKNKKQYHHGDLRTQLLKTAARIVAKEGVDKVTMRTISQRIGVSRTAPYRHFPDKTAILSAVAEDGFKRLKDHLRATMEGENIDALEHLEKLSLAYVDFAVNNPAYYKLMFGKEITTQTPSAELQTAARVAFDELIAAIEACRSEGLIKCDDSLSLANVTWATVHGLSTLIIDGQIQTADAIPGMHTLLIHNEAETSNHVEQLVQMAIALLIKGMKTR